MDELVHQATALNELAVCQRPTEGGLTVVIPTVGRPSLASCLQALVQGNCWPAQIIVVDQGQNPLVADWIESVRQVGVKVTHLPSTQRSPASARNRGIEIVQTPYMAAIDDDCIAQADWLEKMAVRLKQYPQAIITGRVNPGGEGFVPSTVTSDTPAVHTHLQVRSSENIASGNMGFSRQIVNRVGLFDESPLFRGAAEDNDWAYRVLRARIPIVYAPEVVVFHLDWRDNSQLAELYRTYSWSQGALFGKYVRHGDWFMLLRGGLYFFRGVRLWVNGVLFADQHRRIEGRARVTQTWLGFVAGLRRSGTDTTVSRKKNWLGV